ncbi:hypothetical protein [Mesorhizobium sp. ISC11]|uniref:hypothetical protein n=1 Tax=Mesorhizobium sp. ISC11 TaxID=3076428 RepID=UPI00301C6DC1
MAGNQFAQLQRRKKEIEKLLRELKKEMAGIEKIEKDVAKAAAKIKSADDDGDEPSEGGGGARTRSGAKPTQIVKAVKDVLLNSPHPMSRGELLDRLTREGVEIHGTNPPNILGTTLSRAPGFVNLKGFGYWLAERPYAPAGHQPPGSESTEKTEAGDDATLAFH